MTGAEGRMAALQAGGWRICRCTLTTARAYGWGLAFALPFLLLAGAAYRLFLLDRALLLDHTGLILLAVLAVSLPLHEALHGLGWQLAGRPGRGAVRFLFRGGLPLCACRALLPVKAYLAGVLLPFAVLGGGSFLLLLLCPGTVTVLAAFVNLTLPGADLALAWRVLRSGAVLIADCPGQAGFTALIPPA